MMLEFNELVELNYSLFDCFCDRLILVNVNNSSLLKIQTILDGFLNPQNNHKIKQLRVKIDTFKTTQLLKIPKKL